MNQRIEDIIGEFFISKSDDLIQHSSEIECQLLKSLQFEQGLRLSKDSFSGSALFGWSKLKSDFRPDAEKDTIIEVKYIRVSQGEDRSNQHNECDVKNALSQIIEQASCKNAPESHIGRNRCG